MKQVMKLQFFSLVWLLLGTLQVGAIGFVYTGAGGFGRQLMELTSVDVRVTIQDRVAITRTDQVFTSSADRPVEGIYEFALPAEAIITDLVLWIGDKRVQGIVMEKEQARQIYDDIVRQNIDPALIEDIGDGRFRLSIFPFPARGSRRVELEYTQVLAGPDGVMRYRFPLEAETEEPLFMQRFSLDAHISSQYPFSVEAGEAHQRLTNITQENEQLAQVLFADELVRAEENFDLVITETALERLPLVMSYAAPEEEMGYYSLWLPPLKQPSAEVVNRSITFVIDVSGSMAGAKIQAARGALVSALEDLQGDDFFNVIAYGTYATAFAPDPVAASLENIEAAVDYVRKLSELGGTNFEAALKMALPQSFPDGRQNHLIFLTDGQPSVGETNLEKLSQLVEDLAGSAVRIFAIGVGHDVNRSFLQLLAADHNGSSSFVASESDIETELRILFTELTRPVFLPTALSLDGISVLDVYPPGLGLLAAGQELFQVGRYARGGSFTLKLEGRMQEQNLMLEYPLEFATEAAEQGIIPRLWAHQKVKALENQIARIGSNRELEDEILNLGLTYRLVTSRTSLFAPDENVVVNPEPQFDNSAVATAVEEAVHANSWLGKDFLLRGSVWVDVEYSADMPVIGYDSSLGHPAQLEVFASLGEDLIVVLDKTAYTIEKNSLPAQAMLQQNFPNPFNGGTLIRYTLPLEADIELTIYNMAGQKVITLAKGLRQAGTYEVAWKGVDDQGRPLVSGMYLYRLEAGEHVEMKKLMLLQ